MNVGIYLRHPFHRAIFERTHALLGRSCDVNYAHTAGELVDLDPDVVLSGEDITYQRLRLRLPWTTFVHTRHGLAEKGVPMRSFPAADYVCLTSAYIEARFREKGLYPRKEYWNIGYLQMDRLLEGAALPAVGLETRTVLYAPTFQTHLTSVGMLGDRLVESLIGADPRLRLVVKPHPLLREKQPAWYAAMQDQCVTDARVRLVEGDGDIMPWLRAADLLVTDASSVFLEFLPLDRPIVLIDNPQRHDDPNYDPEGLEWLWRDAGERVGEAADLAACVARALESPTRHKERRRSYTELLFGDTCDGRVAERLCERVLALPARRVRPLVSPCRRWYGRAMGHALGISYRIRRRPTPHV